MSYKLAVRVDKCINEVIAFCNARECAGWAVREVSGDNEHWHLLVETQVKPASFRVLLKRAVPQLAGNGSYSVAEVRDLEKYLRYMAKGDIEGALPEVVWKYGLFYTDEKIEELHLEYWQENKSMKKRRVTGVLDHVIDVCKEKRIAWDDRRTIGEEYIKELVARSRPINLFAVKSSVNLIQVKLCPDDRAIQQLSEQLAI